MIDAHQHFGKVDLEYGWIDRIIGLVENRTIDTDPLIAHRSLCEDLVSKLPLRTESANGLIKAVVEF